MGFFYLGFILTTAAAVLGAVYPGSWWGALWAQATAASPKPLAIAVCAPIALIWGVCALFVLAHIISMFLPYSPLVMALSFIGAFIAFVVALSAATVPEEAKFLARIATAHIGSIAATTIIWILCLLCLLVWLSQKIQEPASKKRGDSK